MRSDLQLNVGHFKNARKETGGDPWKKAVFKKLMSIFRCETYLDFDVSVLKIYLFFSWIIIITRSRYLKENTRDGIYNQ